MIKKDGGAITKNIEISPDLWKVTPEEVKIIADWICGCYGKGEWTEAYLNPLSLSPEIERFFEINRLVQNVELVLKMNCQENPFRRHLCRILKINENEHSHLLTFMKFL